MVWNNQSKITETNMPHAKISYQFLRWLSTKGCRQFKKLCIKFVGKRTFIGKKFTGINLTEFLKLEYNL
jgi:hypothetical protein